LKADQTRTERIGEVSKIPKIHFLLRSRGSWMGSVIGFNDVGSNGEFVCYNPFIFFIEKSFPGHKVFKFSTMFSRSENLFNFLFFYSVDDVRRWRGRNLLRRELCYIVRMKKTFVEDQMDFSPLGIYSGSNNCPNVCMFFTKVDNP